MKGEKAIYNEKTKQYSNVKLMANNVREPTSLTKGTKVEIFSYKLGSMIFNMSIYIFITLTQLQCSQDLPASFLLLTRRTL